MPGRSCGLLAWLSLTLLVAALGVASLGPSPVEAAGAEGQLTWALHVSIAPTWFDPAETPGVISPFMFLYALHDGLVKPAILQRVQQLIHDRVMFAPIIEPAFLNGVGARVAESGLGLIAGYPYSSPYEDLKLKPR